MSDMAEFSFSCSNPCFYKVIVMLKALLCSRPMSSGSAVKCKAIKITIIIIIKTALIGEKISLPLITLILISE